MSLKYPGMLVWTDHFTYQKLQVDLCYHTLFAYSLVLHSFAFFISLVCFVLYSHHVPINACLAPPLRVKPLLKVIKPFTGSSYSSRAIYFAKASKV